MVLAIIATAGRLAYGTTARDFVHFWAVSRLVQEGHALLAYDADQFTRMCHLAAPDRHAIHQYFWHYPPTTFLLYWPLAWIPYQLSWLLFTAVTTAFLVNVIRRIVDMPLARWATLASPAVALSAWTGQSAALNAALLGSALLYMEKRPLLSGFSAAVLAFKPQMAAVLWLVECFRFRKALAWSLLIVMIFIMATIVLLGPSVWSVWWHAAPNKLWAPMDRMASLFGMMQYAGLGSALSMLMHLAVALPALGIVVWLWLRKDVAFDIKAAAVPLSTLLLSPYLYYYDFVLVLPSLAFWMRHIRREGAKPGEMHLMALLWVLPVWVGLGMTLRMVPVPQAVLLGALVFLARRSRGRKSLA